jgi:gamma-glutamyltranspeptidase/glutathione hydrolase
MAASRTAALLLPLLVAALAGCAPARPAPHAQPEIATGTAAKPGWHHERHAVAAAHPLAAQAGLETLRAGGSAVDAAIAAQLVLGLVEPQSSGIGGGAFLLLWDGARVRAWDGRETAPQAADETLLVDAVGRPLDFARAAVGGRAVGAPGVLRMLEAAHRAHGRLAWRALFAPAISLAEGGFPLGARLHEQLERDAHLRGDPRARALYYDAAGRALPIGHVVRNPDLGAVLRDVAEHGADAFYRGALAARIADAVQRHPTNPGRLAASDLAGYAAREREPLCFDWRRHLVCGAPPPASGTIVIGQLLGLLERTPQRAARPDGALPGADWLHAWGEAARLAHADRTQHVGDPDFVAAPAGDWRSLLAPAYLDARAALIGERAMRDAPAGRPGSAARLPVRDDAHEVPATSHVSVVDARGHAVALTTSIEAQFGARLMVDSGRGLAGGFLLNNQLTDFSFAPRDAGGALAVNRVQPGKRPRSSMSPTFAFERDGAALRLVLVTGSPGGPAIPHYTARTLLATLAWGFDAQAAADAPNFAAVGGPLLFERGRWPATTLDALRARGHAARETDLTSGIHMLLRTPRGWAGGADPRREGIVAGD